MRLLLAAGLALNAPAAAEVKNPDTLVFAAASDIDSLDPAWVNDVASHQLVYNLYDRLLAFEGEAADRFAPALAARVPSRENGLVSADGRVWRFLLREGATFHDGTPVTPEDVRYSFLRFLLTDPEGGPAATLLEVLTGFHSTREGGAPQDAVYEAAEKAVRVEAGTLVLTLPEPRSFLPALLCTWPSVVSKGHVAANGGWDGRKETWKAHNNPAKQDATLHARALGSGPFRLGRWDTATGEIVLARHDGYWKGPAKLAQVRVRRVDEFGTRRLLLQAGDADLIHAQWTQLSQLKGLPGVEVVEDLPTPQVNPTLHFTFQVDAQASRDIGSGKLDGEGVPPDFFSDADARRGFAFAVDYERVLEEAFQGRASRPRGVVPRGLLGHAQGLPAFEFDLDRAEEHLRKAWGGRAWEKGFRLGLVYNEGNAPRQAVCAELKRNLEAMNPKFKVDVRPAQWSTFLDAFSKRRLPLFLIGLQGLFPDPHAFVEDYAHSRGSYPSAQGWKSAEADRLVEEALGEPNPEKRHALYLRLQDLLEREAPFVVVAHPRTLAVHRTWLKGWTYNPYIPGSNTAVEFHALWKEETP